MSPEDEPLSPLHGVSCTGEDATLSRGDLTSSPQLERRSRAPSSIHTKTRETDVVCPEDPASGKSPFLKILMDAEAAANAASIQLVSFKEALETEFSASRHSASGKHRVRRQRSLLMEKLEDFKKINKSVRQRLKQLQSPEAARVDTKHQIDILVNKIAQAERENENLKREMEEAERKIEQLMGLRREEQENVKRALNLTKSVEATRTHLQAEVRNKEAENNHLTAQLQDMERTVAEQKAEIDDLKGSISTLTEKAAAEKELLRKASRAQKLRAERFEAAVEKCYQQLKEKEAQLTKAHADRDSRRRLKGQITDEKNALIAHVELLESQVVHLTARLQKEKDELAAANKTVMRRVEKLTAENGDLSISNAALKASVAELEKQLAECESALVEKTAVSQERKHQAERWQEEVAVLRAEIDDLRIKHASVLKETKRLREGKDTEVDMVRQELQGRVEELEFYPELLSAAEQRLFDCEKNLQRTERKCSEKSTSIMQLQLKMDGQKGLLRSSVKMKESLHEANSKLRETANSLHLKVEKLQQENMELVRSLAAQEEALAYSNRQLDQRSSECLTLSRQLEAALADVRQQVNRVKDQAVSREEAFQNKILKLEAEKSRRDNELRLLRQSKHKAEKQFEVRLKDLQLSLEQSESHKQSIQNYVDFLKSSYTTMFHEGLQATCFSSSYFHK